MCLVDPNKFWPGFTLTQPGFSKSCWVRFPQLHGTNIYMGLFPGHESLTKNVSCGPKQILTCVYFHSAWFLKNLLGSFPSALRHQHCYRICFPWPWEPKERCASFPLAFWPQTKFDLCWLSLILVSQNLLVFVSLGLKTPTYIYIWLVSLGLVHTDFLITQPPPNPNPKIGCVSQNQI